mmetsp:Transcript_120147/g.311849  ORF Transcript_120147/g.311849 Transcript_120147/m.311849 type:complete len:231 (+) Transcript_120147:325-1017(+)
MAPRRPMLQDWSVCRGQGVHRRARTATPPSAVLMVGDRKASSVGQRMIIGLSASATPLANRAYTPERRMARTTSTESSTSTRGPVKSWGAAQNRIAQPMAKTTARSRGVIGSGPTSACQSALSSAPRRRALGAIARGMVQRVPWTRAPRSGRTADPPSVAALPVEQVGSSVFRRTRIMPPAWTSATATPLKRAGHAKSWVSALLSLRRAPGLGKIAPQHIAVPTSAFLVW